MIIYEKIPNLKNTAVALGCFEGVHLGHQQVIKNAIDSKSDSLDSVILSFSDDIPYKKDSRHIITFEDKCRIFSDMGADNLVIPEFSSICEYSPKDFFKEILVDKLDTKLIACGENYHFGKHAAGDTAMLKKLCEEHNIICKVVSPVLLDSEIISSSRIRSELSKGNVRSVTQMLGRLFSYDFEVVSGRHLGRTLGTPTINQYFPENFVIPMYGVYASVTEIDDRRYHSVTNIGVKPTVGSDKPLSETWIPEFSGDLYGRRIRVSLVQYMRGERKFDSVEELKQAIIQDGVNSKSLTTDYLGENGDRYGI